MTQRLIDEEMDNIAEFVRAVQSASARTGVLVRSDIKVKTRGGAVAKLIWFKASTGLEIEFK